MKSMFNRTDNYERMEQNQHNTEQFLAETEGQLYDAQNELAKKDKEIKQLKDLLESWYKHAVKREAAAMEDNLDAEAMWQNFKKVNVIK